MKNKIIKPIVDIILPQRCALCLCDISAISLCKICESCRAHCNKSPVGPFIFDAHHTGALFYYELKIKEALLYTKFHRSYAHARIVRELIREELPINSHISRLKEFAPTAVCYVPTHWLRKSLRGLDMPSMFAHILAKYLRIPLVHALIKTQLIKPQSSLQSKSSRLLAVRDLFRLRSPDTRYEKLVLVDDIVTTGATFDECLRILSRTSKNIRCLAIAKTP